MSPKATRSRNGDGVLRRHVADSIEMYFRALNGHKPNKLYDLVLEQVEEPLLEAVMRYSHGNQSRAAEILGINRGTLRKKLKSYGIEEG
jgi:Fis family transcriptional regulator